MWPNSGFGPRSSWVELILGWILTLVLLGVLTRALVAVIAPLLPFIGLGLLAIVSFSAAARWRNRSW